MTGDLDPRVLRAPLRAALCLACFGPALSLPQRDGGLDVGTVVIVLLLWGYAGLRSTLSELDPMEEEGFFAQRLRRLVLLPVGMAIGGALLFPLLTEWPYVWFLLALTGLLQRFCFVAEVAVGATFLAGLGVCSQLLLEPEAVWALAPLVVLVFVLPGLDRYVEARARSRAPASPLPLVRGGALVASCVFAATVGLALVLPDPFPALVGTPDFTTQPGVDDVPSLPLAQLLIGTILLGGLWVVAQRLTRAASERVEQPPPGEMQVELDPSELASRSARVDWAPGPRRELVEAYLRHREALHSRGAKVAPTLTPRQVARALPPGRAPDVAVAFERARWSVSDVSADELREVRGWIAEIEGLDLEGQAEQ